ncbi:hypothetical protein [Mucilaginibacter boryungensis]|uniref:Uncharacterized protein n=1 Tax=Mucilaginibacter boryungensis TaxID=768480 RepID=A0ABR9XHP5_9SPHI|nr:hypothetical protein [Mucilaginibacter boryungensis]MBE9666781.1 hypothetical protein [Mucilaginibacter boryungensis]
MKRSPIVAMINDIDEQELKYPIFYSCDWDSDDLKIYQRIKLKLRERGSDIRLLPSPHLYLPIDSFEHKSRWDYQKEFSGLKTEDYSNEERFLIQQLINNDQWIEEESNILKDLYSYNMVLITENKR